MLQISLSENCRCRLLQYLQAGKFGSFKRDIGISNAALGFSKNGAKGLHIADCCFNSTRHSSNFALRLQQSLQIVFDLFEFVRGWAALRTAPVLRSRISDGPEAGPQSPGTM